MSQDKNIIIRIQSSEGTKRVTLPKASTTCELYEYVCSIFDLKSFAFVLCQNKDGQGEVPKTNSRTLVSSGLSHGDLLFLKPTGGTGHDELFVEPVAGTSASQTSLQAQPNMMASTVIEDDVDLQLARMDGKIERQRDEKLCRHNTNARCFHCSPLEPYDEDYLREQKIKHLSFHSFLRKMTSGADRGKFLALEDLTCRIRPGCKDHPPWPKGICSKCQPNAVTLNRQVYRHVDNVQFENAGLVERFLNYWRVTGHQRIGMLYGKYEVHADVPLGIRTVVSAIYEPPQESTRDSVHLMPDDKEDVVNQLAEALGLKPVGWMFTDLIVDDIQKGTVKHTRHVDTYFLSAQECFMAGHYQTMYPNPCKYSSNGIFGSKFVTVCVTGDKTNQVHMEGYQVSNQCMALVRDACFIPTKDAPELGFIKESSDKQYVPDVYYKDAIENPIVGRDPPPLPNLDYHEDQSSISLQEKDMYGNEVSRLARPLPVEYLLLDVPASTPLTPIHTFNPDESKDPFPVENRMVDGHIQDFNALSHCLSQFRPEEFLTAISDFHLLLYIATMDMLPMRDHMTDLLTAIRNKDDVAAKEWCSSEQWATLEQLIAASSPPNSRPGSSVGGNIETGPSGGQQWTCPFCTFLNVSTTQNCEMCNLPRNVPH